MAHTLAEQAGMIKQNALFVLRINIEKPEVKYLSYGPPNSHALRLIIKGSYLADPFVADSNLSLI